LIRKGKVRVRTEVLGKKRNAVIRSNTFAIAFSIKESPNLMQQGWGVFHQTVVSAAEWVQMLV